MDQYSTYELQKSYRICLLNAGNLTELGRDHKLQSLYRNAAFNICGVKSFHKTYKLYDPLKDKSWGLGFGVWGLGFGVWGLGDRKSVV